MKLTNEQQIAVDEFETERDVKVIAYAGAGKTSTLVAMANADEARGGLYIAFNKRIAEEADAKFPFNVRCSTAHSLAFRAIRNQYEMDKLTKNPRMTDAMGSGSIGAISGANSRELVARTLRAFMQSSDAQISNRHVPNLEKLGFVGGDTSDAQAKALKGECVRWADKIWERMINRNNRLPMGHDGYLKLWALGKPSIPADVLFMDEAQDLNPVLIGVLKRQNCQVVAVGDSHQQIYDWRGAVDALELLDGKRCYLTQSFRFGPEIAEQANDVLRMLGETKPLHGAGRPGTLTPYQKGEWAGQRAEAILCRSNGGVIANAAQAFDNDLDVYIPGGVEELKSWVQDADMLQGGYPARPGELMGFASWDAVKEFSGTLDGSHLSVFVKLVENYGCAELRRILDRVLKSPDDRALTISTAHKAKGLEWDSVALDEDFMIGAAESDGGKKKVSASQVRLLYVAMTRAKHHLQMPKGLISAYHYAEVTGLK